LPKAVMSVNKTSMCLFAWQIRTQDLCPGKAGPLQRPNLVPCGPTVYCGRANSATLSGTVSFGLPQTGEEMRQKEWSPLV
jgi:hypothetical protein